MLTTLALLPQGTEAIFKNVVTQEAIDIARQIAEDGVVLLRNEGVLPLDPKQNRRIGVFGQDAGSAPLGATAEGSTGIQPEYYPYGAYTMGGGSGWTYPNVRSISERALLVFCGPS